MIFSSLLETRGRTGSVGSLANPSPEMYSLFGGNDPAYTGKSVTEENAIENVAVFAGVRAIAENLAAMPYFLYKRLERGKEKAKYHNNYKLSHIRPNPEMGSMAFGEAMLTQAIIYGTGYAEIERAADGKGTIKNLWPLLSRNMEVTRKNKRLLYRYTVESINGEQTTYTLRPNRILRIPGFSSNGIIGHPTIRKGHQAISLGLALEEFAARFFGNNARPSAVLTHPGTIGTKGKEKLRKAFDKIHEGLSNAHRMAILEEGMSLQPWGTSPEDSQAIESRKYQTEEICRLLNVPPHILKDLSRSTNNNIEQQSLEFVMYSLQPWAVRVEQAWTLQTLTPQEVEQGYFYEHLMAGLLRGDMETRMSAYVHGIQNGIYNPNECREFENMNPYDGGDAYRVQLNTVDVQLANEIQQSQANQEKPNEDEEKQFSDYEKRDAFTKRDKISNRFEPLIKKSAEKVVEFEVRNLKSQVDQVRSERANSDIEKWSEEFYGKDMPEYLRDQMAAVLRTYAESMQDEIISEIGAQGKNFDEVAIEIEEYIDGFIRQYIDSSKGQLASILRGDIPQDFEGEIVDYIEQRADEWTERRPDKVTQRQKVSVAGMVTAAVIFAGGHKIVWKSRGKSCPFCKQLDGKVVGREQTFVEAGGSIKAKGEKPMKFRGALRYPQAHKGCDCVLTKL